MIERNINRQELLSMMSTPGVAFFVSNVRHSQKRKRYPIPAKIIFMGDNFWKPGGR